MRWRRPFRRTTPHPEPSGHTTPSTGWIVLGVALTIQIATSIVAAALQVLLPLVKAEFHLTFAQAGVVTNFFFFGSFLTIALAGWAVDALGGRIILVVGGLITGAAALACALASAFVVLLGVLLVMGVGIGMVTLAGIVGVRAAFPIRLRGTVMGIRQTGIPLGSFFAALILPSIALATSWRGALAAAGAASIVVAIAGLRIYRSGPRARTTSVGSASLLSLLTRDITVAASSGMLLVIGQFCLQTYLVAYLIHDRNLPITTAAFYLALSQLAGAAGRILWGVVSDRVLAGSRRNALLVAGGSGALGSLALTILPSGFPFALVVVAILVCATGAIGWPGVQVLLLTDLARPGNEGRSVGLGQMIQQPGTVIGPFLFGLIVDATGSFRAGWLLLAVFLGLAVLIMSTVREAPQLRTSSSVSSSKE